MERAGLDDLEVAGVEVEVRWLRLGVDERLESDPLGLGDQVQPLSSLCS